MSTAVWLYETALQVRESSSRENPGSPVAHLAVTPEAAWELQKRSVPYLRLEDCYDEKDLCDRSDSLLTLQAQWTDWVDRYLQAAFPQFQQYGFRPAHLYHYPLKIFMDGLFIWTYVLEHFLRAHQPESVFYFEEELPWRWTAFRGSLLRSILPPLAARHGVPCRAVEMSPAPGGNEVTRWGSHHHMGANSVSWRSLGHALLRILPDSWAKGLRWEARTMRALDLATYAQSMLKRLRPSSTLLVSSLGYDINPLVALIQSLGVKVEVYEDEAPKDGKAERVLPSGGLERLWEEATREAAFWRPFTGWSSGLEGMIKAHLETWWKEAIPDAWASFQSAREHLERRPFGAVLTPLTRPPQDTTLLMAARSLGIPTVIYQHGGFVGNCEQLMWDLTVILNANYVYVYGEGVRAYVEQRASLYREPGAVPLTVGSARLDRVRSGATPKRTRKLRQTLLGGRQGPIALYVPTAFMGYDRYLCCDAYPDVSYSELQQRVVHLFQRFPDVNLLYKEFPVVGGLHNPTPEVIRETLQNGIVVRDIPLTELVWAADLIIVDFPSTGLLEALLTDKPLVIYADRHSIRMNQQAKDLLRKHAVLAETPDDFLQQVEQALSRGPFKGLASPNHEFLCAYGTHLNDGGSAQRAAEALLQVMQGSPLTPAEKTGLSSREK